MEIGAHDEGDAVDLFEALSKTSIHLYHETLRGRTPIDFDCERNRIPQLGPLTYGELAPPKFSIMAEEVSSPWRRRFMHELDANPGIKLDGSSYETVSPDDCDLRQQEPRELFYDSMEAFEDEPGEARTNKSDFGGSSTEQIEPEGVEASTDRDFKVCDSADDLDSSLKQDVRREKATVRAPVLLRIDTELSERYQPRLVEISRPEQKLDDTRSDDESGLPDWETHLQKHVSQDRESQDGSSGTASDPSDFHNLSTCHDNDPTVVATDNESKSINPPDPIPRAQNSLYILPELPRFQPFAPKLMEFFFEAVSATTKDHDL